MIILKTVISISAISTILVILIIIADKFFNNYGECKLKINNEKELTVTGGISLLSALSSHKIFIPSACGGKATCGLCKVKVVDGAGPLLPTEAPYLTQAEIKDGVRLSCQVKVKSNMSLVIPEELFSIREFAARVEKVEQLTHDIKLFRFSLKEPQDISFKAGQYVQIKSKPYGKIRESCSRAYSIASIPSDRNSLELIVRLVPGGMCTTYMHFHLKEGEDVTISGPYGDFYLRDDAKQLIFIAGGSGLAPIKSMVLDILEKGLDKEMFFFFGAVTRKDLYYVEYFKELEANNKNFRYIPALSGPLKEDEWDGETGLITEVVGRHISDANDKQAYLCGSPGMINACLDVLKNKGFKDNTIFYDKF